MGLGFLFAPVFYGVNRLLDYAGFPQHDYTRKLEFRGITAEAGDSPAGAIFVAFVLLVLSPLVGLLGGYVVGHVVQFAARHTQRLSNGRSRVVSISVAAVSAGLVASLFSPAMDTWLNVPYFALIAALAESCLSIRRTDFPQSAP